MTTEVTVSLAEAHELGEGPCWLPATAEVVWVDILARRIRRARLDGTQLVDVTTTTVPHAVGFVAAADDGTLLAGVGTDLVRLVGDDIAVVARTGHQAPGPVRMNDGAVDPAGRVFAGVMGYGAEPGWGALYRFDATGVVRVIDGMTTPNGLGWSPDGETMYVTDSGRSAIDAYRYDAGRGDLGPSSPFVDLSAEEGDPDGLCIDAEGGVWTAVWDAAEVRRYAPDGVLDRVLDVPARRVTACAFAGPELDVLVITSATTQLDAVGPFDGYLFSSRPGIGGLVVPEARL